jgi:hypothetical protein
LARVAELEAERAERVAALLDAQSAHANALAALREIQGSHSWRVTGPLRRLSTRTIRRRGHDAGG